MRVKSIHFFLLLLLPLFVGAQQPHGPAGRDTLYAWRSRFPDYSVTGLSPNGRWAAVTKWHNMVSDTVMMVNTQKAGETPIKFSGMPVVYFGKTHGALSTGTGRAAWWDLSKSTAVYHTGVKKAVLLSEAGQYALLGTGRMLKVMNTDGRLMGKAGGVKSIVSDGRTLLYYLKEEGSGTVLYRWGHAPVKLFATEDVVIRTELTASGKYLILHLKLRWSDRTSVVLINARDGRVHTPLIDGVPSGSFITVSESGGEDRFFFRIQHVEAEADRTVELWYANDGDLKSRMLNKVSRFEYGMYNGASAVYRDITAAGYPAMVSIGSSRYFIVFNKAAGHNYTRWVPDITACLYDAEKDRFHHIGRVREEINVSQDSGYLVFRNGSDRWMLYKVADRRSVTVGDSALRNPTFSPAGDRVYFESSAGLWQYGILNSRLSVVEPTAGFETEVISRKVQHHSTEYNIYTGSADRPDTVVLKRYDRAEGLTSYGVWSRGRYRNVLAPTVNSVRDVKYSQSMKVFVHREANYNMYPQIKSVTLKTRKSGVVYADPLQAGAARSIRRDVISYRDSVGVPLKGLLYYPERFDPAKKYPLVVHIYQIQSGARNEYTFPGELSPRGFDLRALLRKGYFVYLPDIRTGGPGGPGVSALQCVHRSLDAVADRSYIDKGRIGLIGHSHGGYETGFIATRSKRFAAYVSGAGNSDLVRSYFSLNYNFSSPFYWQYENGQYEMKMPFAENKQHYIDNSPVHRAEEVNAPILLWAGKKDQNIAWDQVMEFYVALRRYRKDTIALFYPNQGHDTGINTPEMRDLNERILDWWDYFLKDRNDIPWITRQMKKESAAGDGT